MPISKTQRPCWSGATWPGRAGTAHQTVDGLFRRVANAVAEGDRRFDSKADVVATAKEFYGLMVSLDFLPNSPPS